LGMHQSDVSVLWDLGPHDFSILIYWLGERPSRVMTMGRACIVPGQEDVAFISCEFDSGTIAHIELAWLAPSKLRRTTVVGSNKMVVYDDCSNEPVRVYDSSVVPRNPESFGEFLNYRAGDIVSPRLDPAEPLRLDPALIAAARPRRRAHDRGGRGVAPGSGLTAARAGRTMPGQGDIRVLVLTNMYPTAAEPHLGCFVRDQVEDLRSLGADVEV